MVSGGRERKREGEGGGRKENGGTVQLLSVPRSYPGYAACHMRSPTDTQCYLPPDTGERDLT